MGPTEHDHNKRDQIECTVADTGCDPLPHGRIHRQSRRGIDGAPDQAKRDQNEQEITDIGVDRTVEETIRPRRNVVHPPAERQHPDDGETENPVKRPRDAAPARSRIPYHSSSRRFEFALLTSKCSVRDASMKGALLEPFQKLEPFQSGLFLRPSFPPPPTGEAARAGKSN